MALRRPLTAAMPGRAVLARGLAVSLAAAMVVPAAAAPGPRAEPPSAAAAHMARARAISNGRFDGSLFLCDPSSGERISRLMVAGAADWLPPTRAFDNLAYVGNAFVGVWVLRTAKGLVLFDSAQSEAEVRDHLVPGLKALGLDPASIRYVVVTHGHWDHYGGAKYLQDTYGARIAMSGADWDMLARSAPGALERAPFTGPDRADRPPPRRDLTIVDGQRLVLGDTTVRLYVTPGHTPGTISAVIPAREHGRTWPLVLLGGTAFPPTLEGNAHTGGLVAFDHSGAAPRGHRPGCRSSGHTEHAHLRRRFGPAAGRGGPAASRPAQSVRDRPTGDPRLLSGIR